MKYVFMLNESVTAWMSKKQCTVLTLTMKVKYIALEHEVKQEVWMQRFTNELELNCEFKFYSLQIDIRTDFLTVWSMIICRLLDDEVTVIF